MGDGEAVQPWEAGTNAASPRQQACSQAAGTEEGPWRYLSHARSVGAIRWNEVYRLGPSTQVIGTTSHPRCWVLTVVLYSRHGSSAHVPVADLTYLHLLDARRMTGLMTGLTGLTEGERPPVSVDGFHRVLLPSCPCHARPCEALRCVALRRLPLPCHALPCRAMPCHTYILHVHAAALLILETWIDWASPMSVAFSPPTDRDAG